MVNARALGGLCLHVVFQRGKSCRELSLRACARCSAVLAVLRSQVLGTDVMPPSLAFWLLSSAVSRTLGSVAASISWFLPWVPDRGSGGYAYRRSSWERRLVYRAIAPAEK